MDNACEPCGPGDDLPNCLDHDAGGSCSGTGSYDTIAPRVAFAR